MLRGGLSYYSFDSTPGSTNTPPIRPPASAYELDTYYFGLSINHRLTEFITHGVSLIHSVQPGVNQGSDYIESTDADYHVSWNLTQNTTVGAHVTYTRASESQTDFLASTLTTTTEDYDLFRLGVNGSYRLSSHSTISLTYDHSRRASNNKERDYFVNRVSLNLGYRF